MLLVRIRTLYHSSSSVFNTYFFLTFCFGLIFNFLYHFISCRFKVFYLTFGLWYRLLPPTMLCKHWAKYKNSAFFLLGFYSTSTSSMLFLFSFFIHTSHYYLSFDKSSLLYLYRSFHFNSDSCLVCTHFTTGK